jgi:hypothetical protein
MDKLKNTEKFHKIIHDIRNFRHLTKEQITALLNLNEKEKDEILLLYNEVILSYIEYLKE